MGPDSSHSHKGRQSDVAMLDKDPDLWAQAWEWLRLKLSDPLWQGAVMAATISLLRVLYEGKEANKWRVVLEALICGALSLSASSVIEWMAWPSSLSVAAGGAIGFIGVTAIRELIIRFLGRRADTL